MKTLNVRNTEEALAAGCEIFGDPDTWVLIAKAWNDQEEWMKTTNGMEIPGPGGGVIVHTQFFQREKTPPVGLDIQPACSESMVYIPGAMILISSVGKDTPDTHKIVMRTGNKTYVAGKNPVDEHQLPAKTQPITEPITSEAG